MPCSLHVAISTNPNVYNINVLEAKLATYNEFILLDAPAAK